MRPTTSTIGAVLQDRYRLDAVLGTGASARVFRAYDLELRREVAIKRLHPGLGSDDAFLVRFRSEARAAAALNHPLVVQIYDWCQDDEGGFLVLEYLAGGSLRDLLDSGAVLGPSEVAQIGAQAASALSFAHGKGIVHRDVKPANLLFDEAGNAHVADFGLARAMVDASWTEPIGMVFGTARYASPEQARGADIDDRSDVYSLALVCYEALVGVPPFQADTPLATLIARVGATLPNLEALGVLAPALVAATANDPEQRLDANGFAEALNSVGASLSPPHLPIGVGQHAYDPSTYDTGASDTGVSEAGLGLDGAHDADTAVFDVARTEEIATFVQKPDDTVAPPKPRRRRRRMIVVATVAVVLAAIAAVLIVRLGVYGNTVPSVARLSSVMATTRLRDAGLRVGALREQYSPTIAAGDVISQSVRPGSNLRGGSTVDLVVSKGHAPEAVPQLTGLSETAATHALQQRAFVVKNTPVYSETVAANDVVSASPAKGTAPYGSTVVLDVSKGPHPRTIPDLSGMSITGARSALEGLRLIPKNTRAYSASVPSGEVISSDPAAGTSGVVVGSTVKIIISRGPQLVAIPSVAGLPIANAIAALQAAGLVVSEQIGPPFARFATTTEPGPGTMVAPNSSVTVYAA